MLIISAPILSARSKARRPLPDAVTPRIRIIPSSLFTLRILAFTIYMLDNQLSTAIGFALYEMPDTDFNSELSGKARLVNRTLKQLLANENRIDGDLKEALRYTLETPGKRVRSALVLWCCELVAGRVNRNAELAAAAVEMVHTYSLVHDDLPAMDDDDLRRGVPTCPQAFDEATAVLTGAALLPLGFEILAS